MESALIIGKEWGSKNVKEDYESLKASVGHLWLSLQGKLGKWNKTYVWVLSGLWSIESMCIQSPIKHLDEVCSQGSITALQARKKKKMQTPGWEALKHSGGKSSVWHGF